MLKSPRQQLARVRPIVLLIAIITICTVGISHLVQSSFALTNGGSITTLGVPLTENFDTLASTGTAITWTDSSTVAAWYSNRTAYNTGTGSSTTGGLYSFGVAGTGPVTDRALGSVASGTTGSIYQAVRLTNNTGTTLTSLSISYVGEQWRDGGNATPAAQALTFQYQAANAGVITAANAPSTGWTTPGVLSFASPIATTTATVFDGNAAANRVAISGTLAVTVNPGQEIWLRWEDLNDSGNDHALAVDDFSVTAFGIPSDDNAPSVLSTAPANSATNVAVTSTIVVNFDQSVAAAADAFDLTCATARAFTLSSSPGSSFTLTPSAALPYSSVCSVTVTAAQITGTDAVDPPDHMAVDYSFSFTTADRPITTNVIINEADSDTPGTDVAEFVEVYDGGVGNTPLDGLVVVFYNGSNDLSYAAFDLDGYSTNASGYFTLGNPGVPGVDLIFDPDASGLLQNGADAVALYAASASDFPTGTLVTTTNLQDAIVYDTDDADDPGLLVLLNAEQPQVNENGGGSGQTQSSQRCPNGSGAARNTSTYLQNTPTPDEPNACPPPPPPSNSMIVVSQLYGGGGTSGASYQNDYVELYNRGTTTVDIGGWSLQYASATGSGWDFNRQPLGGTIAPGEYYLIALASNGAVGAPLPSPNITGELNMSGTSGKIALVDNFDALLGNCPIGSPHIMDFVGYGSADCREGTTAAPSPSAITAIFRSNGGSTDSDRNGSDFLAGSPSPRRTAPIVELGPIVLSTDPVINGTNAPRDATIVVRFTEPVDVIGPWFDITCAGSGQHNIATFAGAGKDHYITPNLNFIPGEPCTVTIFKDQIHDLDLDDAAPNADTLAANYVWSFTVATGTPPPYASSVHLAMGNPSGATASLDQPNNYLMEKPEFSLSYNRDLGRPNWVSWHLSDEWIGSLIRVDTFRADPAVPPEWYRVQSFDFAGSGFDRGHMTPNADRDKETSSPINQATFLMSNMVAQAPDNNQGPWAEFESYLRTLLPANEVYIVAGAYGSGGTGSNGAATTLANGHVTVPASTWKVGLVLPKGDDDILRVSCATRTIAVIMPNTQGIRNDPWENYLTNVDSVEALTGYDLLSNLPEAIQTCVEAGTNGNNPPLDTMAPGISCASPDGAWHAENVSLACTANDSGSGLANANDASFSLLTSVAAGTETANASTGSRLVCDFAGNCATAVIGGNRIDRKPPSIVVTAPATAAEYQWKQVVDAAYSCSDGGSGSATCAAAVANLTPVHTSTPGSKTFVVNAADAVGNAASMMVPYTVQRKLTAVDSAKLWVGLQNSDDAGLRLDLRAEVLVNDNVAASGVLNNVNSGTSGFNNAILQSLPLALSAAVDVPADARLAMRVLVRRTCNNPGRSSGTVREWFNGQPTDSGANRDAGSRVRLTLSGNTNDYFLRSPLGLSTTAGTARTSLDLAVNGNTPCTARPFSPIGVWSVNLP
jgi:DNA/RNA endonuclease G (NUC1)